MARTSERLPDSTIASSEQAGTSVVPTARWAPTAGLGIQTPDELTGNVVLRSSNDDGATWQTVAFAGSGGIVDVALPPGHLIVVDPIPGYMFRPFSDSPEIGDRVFQFWCILDI